MLNATLPSLPVLNASVVYTDKLAKLLAQAEAAKVLLRALSRHFQSFERAETTASDDILRFSDVQSSPSFTEDDPKERAHIYKRKAKKIKKSFVKLRKQVGHVATRTSEHAR